MRSATVLFCLLTTTAFAANVPDKVNPDPGVGWMAKTMLSTPQGRHLTLPLAEQQMLSIYKTMVNGDVAAQSRESSYAPKQRAQMISRFLEKDLDNDGRVTTEELKIVLDPQSKMTLRSNAGVEVNPTAEQIDEIMQQLLARNLDADTNADGVIDFDEMRAAAAAKTINAYGRISGFRLIDPIIVKWMDASADKKISQDEFLAAVRKTFAALDQDKDGRISSAEAKPYLSRNTSY